MRAERAGGGGGASRSQTKGGEAARGCVGARVVGTKPHLPVKTRLVRRHQWRRTHRVARLVRQLKHCPVNAVERGLQHDLRTCYSGQRRAPFIRPMKAFAALAAALATALAAALAAALATALAAALAAAKRKEKTWSTLGQHKNRDSLL